MKKVIIRDKKGRFLKGFNLGHPSYGGESTRFKKGHKLLKGSEKGWFLKNKMVGSKNPRWKGGISIHFFGYKLILSKDHPFKTNRGYVREHRLIMEKYLGRHLTKKEVIHHIDGNKNNNNISNLMLFPNHSEHMKYEQNKKI